MGNLSLYIRKAVSVFFEYDTPKIVHIKSKKVGIINRFIQLVIISYVVGYAIVWQKGYQEFDSVQSGVTTKVKGTVYTNYTNITGLSSRIWDVADFVIPPQQTNAFFVMTNFIITPNQSQSTCPEDVSLPDAHCNSSADCFRGESVLNGNGVKTGNCVDSVRNSTQKVCEIYAWCPVEKNEPPLAGEAVLKAAENFTVLIKNNIQFPLFSFNKRNILPEVKNSSYLNACRWNKVKDVYCPVFQLGDIVKEAGVVEFNNVAYLGGVIAIEITWNCNLDLAASECVPKYSFRRLDIEDSPIAKGWNFRTADHFVTHGKETRNLIKAYGILFKVFVRGKAGRFNFVPLVLNLGAGLALLTLATIICDVVVLYFLKQRNLYKKKKYLEVTGEDAFQIYTNEECESIGKSES